MSNAHAKYINPQNQIVTRRRELAARSKSKAVRKIYLIWAALYQVLMIGRYSGQLLENLAAFAALHQRFQKSQYFFGLV